MSVDDARREYNRRQKQARRAALSARTSADNCADNADRNGVENADIADTGLVENDENVREMSADLSANFAADFGGRSRSEAKASAPTPAVVRVSANDSVRDSVRADNREAVRADSNGAGPEPWTAEHDFGDERWIARNARRQDWRASTRDRSAIDACGLCDANGFVTITSDGPIPTVAFCSHQTTIAAWRKDLQ